MVVTGISPTARINTYPWVPRFVWVSTFLWLFNLNRMCAWLTMSDYYQQRHVRSELNLEDMFLGSWKRLANCQGRYRYESRCIQWVWREPRRLGSIASRSQENYKYEHFRHLYNSSQCPDRQIRSKGLKPPLHITRIVTYNNRTWTAQQTAAPTRQTCFLTLRHNVYSASTFQKPPPWAYHICDRSTASPSLPQHNFS